MYEKTLRKLIAYCPNKGYAIPENQRLERPERWLQQMAGDGWKEAYESGDKHAEYMLWALDALVRRYIINGCKWRDLRATLMSWFDAI